MAAYSSIAGRSPQERGDAALRTAGFVVLAVALLTGAYGAVALLALVAAIEPPLVPVGTVTFLALAAALGIGTDAVFAFLARLVEPDRVGAVTGVVGAAGGLGGFFPPLVMALVYGALGDYSVGFVLLAITAAAAGVLTVTSVRRRVRAAAVDHGANGSGEAGDDYRK